MRTSFKALMCLSLLAINLGGCGQTGSTEASSENSSPSPETAFDAGSVQYIYQLNDISSSAESEISCENAQQILERSVSGPAYFYFVKGSGGGWSYALRPSSACTTNPKYTGLGMCVTNDTPAQVSFEGKQALISQEIEGCKYDTRIDLNEGISLGSTTSSGSCSSPASGKVEKYLVCNSKAGAASLAKSGGSPVSTPAEAQSEASQNELTGIWNVYKSLKYVPTPSGFRSSPNFKEAELAQEVLMKCNVETRIGITDGFKSFTKGLMIVYSGPFSDSATAKAELEQAKSCGFEGYSKKSSRE